MAAALAGGATVESVVDDLVATEEGLNRSVQRTSAALRAAVGRDWETGAPSPRLVFLHIMKVGGTSLCDMMSEWLPPGRSQVHMFLDDVVLQPRLVTARQQLIAGHLPFEALALVPPPFSTMCVLRDPQARTLSHYADLRRNVPRFADLSLDEFLASDEFAVPRGNYQARQLAHQIGIADAWVTYSPLVPYVARGGDPDHPYPIQALFDSTEVGLDDDGLLRTARTRLAGMDIVGTTDDIDTIGGVVAAFFGAPPQPVPHLNVSPTSSKVPVPDGARRRIDEVTAVDRELYDLARRRAAQLRATPPAAGSPAR